VTVSTARASTRRRTPAGQPQVTGDRAAACAVACSIPGSTPSKLATMARRLLWVGLAALAIAAVTALIFLIRAGDPGTTNWPIYFELRSSDNGVLFQFASDVFNGRALDWSFSPQVFVFPEIPISLVAYLLAGGTVQLYYLFVAAMYNATMFLGLFAIIRYLCAAESLGRRLARATIAMFPLLLLPLLGNTWLFEYALAPTYYFGMYVMILIAPLLFFPCRPWVKVLVGVGLALTSASNPLALVFVLPALACVLLVRGLAGGFRSVARPAAWSAGVVALALLIRVLFFGRLQGQSPFDYVSTSIFSGRIDVIVSYAQSLLATPTTAIVLVLGSALAVAGLVIAIVLAVRLIRRRIPNRAAQATALYYALVPADAAVAARATEVGAMDSLRDDRGTGRRRIDHGGSGEPGQRTGILQLSKRRDAVSRREAAARHDGRLRDLLGCPSPRTDLAARVPPDPAEEQWGARLLAHQS
jgi:hypothetical protein